MASDQVRRCGFEVILTGSQCTVSALVVAATVLAVEAAAQDRFVVRGIVGANVGSTTRTTGVWGAGVGVNVGPIVQLTGEVGREIGRATVRDLPLVIDLPSDPSLEEAPPPPGYAIRIVFLERAQVDYFALAGVRLRAPTRRWLNPFGEASIGFARITTHWIPAPAFVGHETRALFELGGGVSLPMKNRLALEIEYRFTRPQAYSGSRNANKLHAALALGI